MERGSVLHMFSIASSRSEQTRTTLPPSLLSLSSLSLFSSPVPSFQLHPCQRKRLTTSLRTSCFRSEAVFRLKSLRHTSLGCTLALYVARNYTLASFSIHETNVRISEFNLEDICSRSLRNFILSLFNYLRTTPSPRMLFSTLPPPRSDSPELFQSPARGGGVFIPVARSHARSRNF